MLVYYIKLVRRIFIKKVFIKVGKLTESQQNFLEKSNSSIGPRTEAQKRRAKIISKYINREVEKRLKEFEKFKNQKLNKDKIVKN